MTCMEASQLLTNTLLLLRCLRILFWRVQQIFSCGRLFVLTRNMRFLHSETSGRGKKRSPNVGLLLPLDGLLLSGAIAFGLSVPKRQSTRPCMDVCGWASCVVDNLGACSLSALFLTALPGEQITPYEGLHSRSYHPCGKAKGRNYSSHLLHERVPTRLQTSSNTVLCFGALWLKSHFSDVCKTHRDCNLYLRPCLVFRPSLPAKQSTLMILWEAWVLGRMWPLCHILPTKETERLI